MMRFRLITLSLFVSISGLAQEAIIPEDYETHLLVEALFKATNELRASKGLTSLKENENLKKAAQYQANRMAKRKSLQHRWSGDKKFGTPRQRIEAHGGNFKTTGENIAQDYLLNIPSGKPYYLDSYGEARTRNGERIPYRSYKELAHKIVNDWYRSKRHRENLLGDFKYLGIGASFLVPEKKGPNFDVYLVQNFGT